MSSIFGKIHLDDLPVVDADMQAMQGVLSHWKPDVATTWTGRSAGFGHLMLWNTPLSMSEKQPFHLPSLNLVITADARLDNRGEIGKLLGLETNNLASLPDSELIIRLYVRHGNDCVRYLTGDFAFAIWHTDKKLLFCARDQMGIKPFFYYRDPRFFAFASEKKGLLAIPGMNRTISKDYFFDHLQWPPVHAADTTLYTNIRRLPPAHTLLFEAGKNRLQLHRYWAPDTSKELRLSDRREYYDGLREHFRQAVECRLSSSFPVGIELSGGLDSSAITGMAAAIAGPSASNLFTFSNAGDLALVDAGALIGEDERKYMEAVISFNSIGNSVMIDSDIFENPLDEADRVLSINDGLDNWSLPWLLPLNSAARDSGVRTLLSGFPGDEMVTYRGQYRILDYLDNRQYAQYFKSGAEKGFKKIKPFLTPGTEFVLHRLRNLLHIADRKWKMPSAISNMPLRYRMRFADAAWSDPFYRDRFRSHRHYQVYRLLKPEVSLRLETETRIGISYRLEPRFPMADIRLVDYYLSLPNELKCEGTMDRDTWRNAMSPFLPELVRTRQGKSGNLAPFRFTPDKNRKRISIFDTLLHQLSRTQMTYNKLFLNTPINEPLLVRYIEILRWLEKNPKILH